MLGDDGLAKAPGPVDVVVEKGHDFGVVQQRYDRIVPIGVGFQRGIGFEILEKARSLDDLQWIGGGRQDYGEQVVGIQRDRADQFLEFCRSQERYVLVADCRRFCRRLVIADDCPGIVNRHLSECEYRCGQRDSGQHRASYKVVASSVHCFLLTGRGCRQTCTSWI